MKVLKPSTNGLYITSPKNEGCSVGYHDIGIPINQPDQPGFHGFRCSARVARYGVSAVVMMFIFPWPAAQWNVGKRRIAMKVWKLLCVRNWWVKKVTNPGFNGVIFITPMFVGWNKPQRNPFTIWLFFRGYSSIYHDRLGARTCGGYCCPGPLNLCVCMGSI